MNKELRELKRLKRLIKNSENNDNYNIYNPRAIDNHLDNDCITAAEHGFMLGYLDT